MESLNEEVKFTVFCEDGFWPETTLALGIASLLEEGDVPIAWAREKPLSRGGDKDWKTLLRESIAAGRLIEKQADGSFIPRGVGGEALFRVGGIYKQQDGNLRRLAAVEPADFALASASARSAYADTVPVVAWFVDRPGATWGDGWRRLSDGKYHGTTRGSDLIPGELNEQGEPISCGSPIAATPPTTEPKAEKLSADSAMRLRDLRGDAPARAARWASKQKAKADTEREEAIQRAIRKDLGTARNPHPHWGAAVGLVK